MKIFATEYQPRERPLPDSQHRNISRSVSSSREWTEFLSQRITKDCGVITPNNEMRMWWFVHKSVQINSLRINYRYWVFVSRSWARIHKHNSANTNAYTRQTLVVHLSAPLPWSRQSLSYWVNQPKLNNDSRIDWVRLQRVWRSAGSSGICTASVLTWSYRSNLGSISYSVNYIFNSVGFCAESVENIFRYSTIMLPSTHPFYFKIIILLTDSFGQHDSLSNWS